MTGFVAGMMDRRRSRAFLDDLEAFADRVAEAGLRNSLGQQVLKLTSPGIPDIYQGTELWDDSLVDPDNRRPVDFEARVALLEAADEPSPLWDDRRSGAVKLAVTARLLNLRATYAELFAEGDYRPLTVTGECHRHVIAFARSLAGQHLIVAVARLTADLDFERNETVWGDTGLDLPADIDAAPFVDVLTGATVPIATTDDRGQSLMASELLARLPVAVLLSAGPEEGGEQ
ncbi:MAG: hypothetical protein H0W23_04975 [Chloroflexia bacterium]|nr:hypothetical protein [Chloroflexia bacterium]